MTDLTTARDPAGPQLRKEFTVKSGETLDLGDILIEKPLRSLREYPGHHRWLCPPSFTFGVISDGDKTWRSCARLTRLFLNLLQPAPTPDTLLASI